MSVEQKRIVQASFQELLPVSEVAAELFYKRLFALNPAVRVMFKVDIHEQERKLMDMLRIAVYGLDSLDQLLLALRQLGLRHLEYGVKPEHYVLLEEALFWMLEQAFEDGFNPEVREAWKAVYKLLTDTMING